MSKWYSALIYSGCELILQIQTNISCYIIVKFLIQYRIDWNKEGRYITFVTVLSCINFWIMWRNSIIKYLFLLITNPKFN